MARLPRFILPGFPQHVLQRGNNRRQILFREEDYWFLWEKIGTAAEKFECSIHAYCLMPNHFHLLLTPLHEDGIGKLMQYVGRCYVQYFNSGNDRTGTLWDGRYRATLLDPADWMIPVSRYVEGNPVRAGLVSTPADYAWSSFAANATGAPDRLVTASADYERLGRGPKTRQAAYAKGFAAPLDEARLTRIRDATNKAWVLGDAAFCAIVEERLNRRTSPRARGGDRRSAAYRMAAARP
ncbi:transposase [uncultured Thiodictyon sp.]|jgi:putative transposase|uniref:transposase n=1 Tax=uncultured Thiodictyon sp. TaxID=1846217 RepID=UPI0025CCEEAC|nr:transposase [uncultured Thiodictyon sp.]